MDSDSPMMDVEGSPSAYPAPPASVASNNVDGSRPDTPMFEVASEQDENITLPKFSCMPTEQELLQDVKNCVEQFPKKFPSKTKLQLQVNRITLSSTWKWSFSKDDDRCGICRGQFESCCSSCRFPGDGCPLALGDCRHPFHSHCISKWVESQSRPSCPLCRMEWRTHQNASPIALNATQ